MNVCMYVCVEDSSTVAALVYGLARPALAENASGPTGTIWERHRHRLGLGLGLG